MHPLVGIWSSFWQPVAGLYNLGTCVWVLGGAAASARSCLCITGCCCVCMIETCLLVCLLAGLPLSSLLLMTDVCMCTSLAGRQSVYVCVVCCCRVYFGRNCCLAWPGSQPCQCPVIKRQALWQLPNHHQVADQCAGCHHVPSVPHLDGITVWQHSTQH